jgi:murein DD-endopeptidase MepM/ murein hydrolase activator NlpD
MFGGSRALVGEANEAEVILPMSKIGDALSAVYREGASVMVGATLAFLGPLAGGSAAAAGLLSEARRIAQITGADTDVKVNKVELPDLSGTPDVTNTTSSSTESTSDVTKMTTGGQDNSQINMTTSLKGTDRWKTILPQGDPLFSSPFGPRWGRMHRGIDIGVWEDSPVHAQEDGVVEQILPKFGEYGGAVVVSHKDGTANLYGHVHAYTVEKGQKVMKGDQLAKIQYYPGKDGSNQSHLHFERFNKSGTRIDPLPYFSQGGANTPPEKKETKMDSVNKGGPNLRNISSNFVNLGSQTKRNNQTLIDTPVNVSKTASTSSPQMIPVPEPYPVPVIKKEYVPVEETEKQQRMVIDVFGKGAART